jgi:ribosomal protein L29
MPDIPIADAGDDGYAHPMEERVSKVEADIRDIKSSIFDMREIIIRMDAKLDATLPHLATKAEFADLRTEMATGFSNLRTEMVSGDAALRHEMMDQNAALRTEIAANSAALLAEMAASSAALRKEMADNSAELRKEMADNSTELRKEIADVSATLRAEMADTSATLRAEMAALRVEMVAGFAEKPSKTYMWGILAVLLTAYGCGLAGLAILK